jgi:hypothetical protein
MGDKDGWFSRIGPSQLALISICVAMLSMGSSFFQSWNYARNIESVQRNVLRAENLRTCRDIIDVFFQFRLKAEEAQASGKSAPNLKALVYRFGALGTFLANFRDEPVRQRYSKLSWEMNAIAAGAATLSPAEFQARFAVADTEFATLNEDCVRAAQSRLL